MTSGNIFSWKTGLPFHISVGAVVVNDKSQVLVHHFLAHAYYKDSPELYLLMRETIDPNESIEQALARGLGEEFGLKAKVKEYIGSLTAEFRHGSKPIQVEKTTLYFLCDKPIELKDVRKLKETEGQSLLEWHQPGDLVNKSRQQAVTNSSSDLDESKILERVAEILESQS